MSLLSFLTGMTEGANQSVQAEREKTEKEQQGQLDFRKNILGMLVNKAMTEGGDPKHLAWAMRDYMDASQPLSARPSTGGFRGGMRGQKNLGNQTGQPDLLEQLMGGALSVLGPKPGAMTIQMPPKPLIPGLQPNAEMSEGPAPQPSLPQLVPGAVPQTGVPSMFENPEVARQQDAVTKFGQGMAEHQALSEMDLAKQRELYGIRYAGNGLPSLGGGTWIVMEDGTQYSTLRDKMGTVYAVTPQGNIPIQQLPGNWTQVGSYRPAYNTSDLGTGVLNVTPVTPNLLTGKGKPTEKTTHIAGAGAKSAPREFYDPARGAIIKGGSATTPTNLPDREVTPAQSQAAAKESNRQAQLDLNLLDKKVAAIAGVERNPATDKAYTPEEAEAKVIKDNFYGKWPSRKAIYEAARKTVPLAGSSRSGPGAPKVAPEGGLIPPPTEAPEPTPADLATMAKEELQANGFKTEDRHIQNHLTRNKERLIKKWQASHK
jgi:hypothetical protein